MALRVVSAGISECLLSATLISGGWRLSVSQVCTLNGLTSNCWIERTMEKLENRARSCESRNSSEAQGSKMPLLFPLVSFLS